MRGLALLATLVLAITACKHKGEPSASRVDVNIPSSSEVSAPALSAIKMNDPAAERQLEKGFYGVEAGSWRWTSSKFAVTLHPPGGAAEKGATLEFKFSAPEVILNKVGAIALSATVNGVALPPQTYSKSGEYVYKADVPATALQSAQVHVEFSTDKAIPPSGGDKRELALVAVSVALQPK